MKDIETGVVLVAYNPEKDRLNKVLEALCSQVAEVCVVDNSAIDNSSLFSLYSNINYIALKENKGIAAAQNIGIKYFENKNWSFVLFIDQDSVITPDLVVKLRNAYDCLNNKGYNVGVVGTRAYNSETDTPYPPKSKEFKVLTTADTGYNANITEVYSVISSVSVIPTKLFSTIGYMDESLFIDGVDHEWCWRAYHEEALRSFIVEDAIISHQFGIGDKNVGDKRVSISSPIRTYFQFRNYLWLCRRSYTPKFWKKKHFMKYIYKSIYFPLFVAPRLSYFTNILRGISDGLLKSNKAKY
ncbi:glycosyltransferase [Dysgonomonas capnocytophagoides]|uniref:glycosyltransferase n=1 Tax=Dysgonomonas capnocytophagoides TaxID=45254 RepID=UPI00333E806F